MIADAVQYLWGADNKTGPERAGPGRLGGDRRPALSHLRPRDASPSGRSVALGLWLLFYRTRWGMLIRAATQDREMVAALGVDQSRLFTGVFVLGCFLAGLGGALQVPRVALTTVMDTAVIVEAFVVVVIGGMGSVWGALLASLLIGVLNAFGILHPAADLHRADLRGDGGGADRAAVGPARPARGRSSARRAAAAWREAEPRRLARRSGSVAAR